MLEKPFLTVKEKNPSVEIIRLIEVVNKVKTLDQELCKEMIEKVSRKVLIS